MRKYDSGLGEHGTRTKGAENGVSQEAGRGKRDNKTKTALKNVDPRLQTRRRNGAAHPGMWGIKVGVLEWKMRPFGLKKLQKTIYPNGPVVVVYASCIPNPPEPLLSTGRGKSAVADDERRIVSEVWIMMNIVRWMDN